MRFGGVQALADISLKVPRGAIFGVIGPNGAGKTTLFNILSGAYRPSAGTIAVGDMRIDGLSPAAIAKCGVSRTFQNIRLVRDMTVLENVLIGQYRVATTGLANITGKARAAEREMRVRAGSLLRMLSLWEVRDRFAAELPYATQRRVEVARAIAINPTLLLLDEPTAGMDHRESDEIVEIIRLVHRRWRPTILLIEHDMNVVMGLCDRIAVFNFGLSLPKTHRPRSRRIRRCGRPISARTPRTILRVENLAVSDGPIRALHGVSVALQLGELVSIVGPNGAGKTTLMRAISGLIPVAGGEILMNGAPITRQPTHKRVAGGLLQVPEGRAILQAMTVWENLQIAFEHGSSSRPQPEAMAEMFALFPILASRRQQRAGTLSGGEQQMLALARALLAEPKVLLLDEPSLGLAPLMMREVFRVIASLRQRGVSVLLVEQNVREALKVADRGYVLELGRVVAAGTAAELADRREILAAYLGVR